MYRETPMFGDVAAHVGLHVTEKKQGQTHAAHMLQACGLGSSQNHSGSSLTERKCPEKAMPK